MQQLIAGVLLLATCYAIYVGMRARLRRTPTARARILAGASVCLFLGVIVGLVVPRMVPETSGSPASMVLVIVLWIVGGVLVLFGLPALIAALSGGRAERNGTGG